ncbi:hypothetical protein [Romboutsia sp.]|uniref:hypothetical protein n=1 Tax=Romboutsia sp. TaxID=1965302 RepID=UPI002CDA2873|nr:hypothetical protein [Romboutsia sp.]HSQ88047.1 hypothetical protein [Romboutsia sp.]
MLESSITYILLRTFPESIVLVLSGLILLGIKIDTKNVMKKGMLLGILITFIRLLPINFGVHTILSMIVVEIILYKSSENQLVKSMISTFMIWISLALSEGIYILIATGIFKIPFDKLANNKSLYGALTTLPSLLILIGIVFIFKAIIKKINTLM